MPEQGPSASQTATILVVDDSPTVRAHVRKVLEKQRYRVFEEGDPMFAPQSVVRHAPHLVLLDVAMRSLKGGRVAAILRTDRQRNPSMRIVYYSSLPEDELAALVEETAADGYISKSVSDAALVAEIKALLADVV